MSAPTPPVVDQIVRNMQVALQSISRANGFFHDVKASSVVLDAVSLDTVPATEVPYFVLGHRVEPVNRDWHRSRSGVLGAIEDRWRILIEARIDAPGTGTARKLTPLSQLEADIERALVADLQRGGLALYTYVQQGTRYTGLPAQDMTYLEVPVEVSLNRPYGQP